MSYTSPICTDPAELYDLLSTMAGGLLDGETDSVSATANLSALIYDLLPDLNWAGFYRVKNDVLVLGPFQGKPACNRIAKGKGVCGTAWLTDRAQVVPDVHQFPGHIACDGASNSELVIPIHDPSGKFCALLDLDSPKTDRFTVSELQGLLPLIKQLEDWMVQLNVYSL